MHTFRRTALMLAIMALTVVSVTGCNTIKEERRGNELTMSLRTFSKLLRWGMFEDASQYLRNSDDEEIPVDLDSFEGVKVTDFETISQGMSEDGLEATITSQVAYYRQDTGVLREIRYKQVWWYDPEAERWFIDGQLPDFR
ncbi:MAG: hypothetical protein KJO38_02425 [Gammaproteobacteria bacterium]|nr:hypothetical protein [Gammaproteobacteria bacterium]